MWWEIFLSVLGRTTIQYWIAALVLVATVPVFDNLLEAGGADDVAECGDPVHEHADQLDDQDADEPEDEEEPYRLQLVVLIGPE